MIWIPLIRGKMFLALIVPAIVGILKRKIVVEEAREVLSIAPI